MQNILLCIIVDLKTWSRYNLYKFKELEDYLEICGVHI